MSKKISVIGLWRDSQNTASQILDALENISKVYNLDYYFYENDSIDNTKIILDNWLKDKDGKLLSEKLNFPKYGSVPDTERLILLSFYRNKAKNLANASDSEYTLLIDTDVFFTTEQMTILYDTIIDTNAAMVVANTRAKQVPDLMHGSSNDVFYDVFAFRDALNNNGLYFTDCPLIMEQDRKLWFDNRPVRINSGFSGFCLIKTSILKECFWSTISHSEHVNFCYQVQKHGNIFIVPSCKPSTNVEVTQQMIDSWTTSAKQQINIMNRLNYIYNLSTSSDLKLS